MELVFDPKRLAGAISATRNARGWSQAHLAEEADVSVTTVQRLELTAGQAKYPTRPSVFAGIERAFHWPAGRCLAIGEGRVGSEEIELGLDGAVPVSSPTAGPADDEFVRDLMRRPISQEARAAIVDAYLAEKAKDEERRRRADEARRQREDEERRREDEERRRRFLRIVDTTLTGSQR